MRQFVAGTGGYPLYGRTRSAANSEVFHSDAWGVLKLTLKSASYAWEFIPVDGRSFRDSGTGACYGPPLSGSRETLRSHPSSPSRSDELDERFVRASGPGGQNVNKVATAVELRFDVPASSPPDEVKARLAALAGKRMSAEGVHPDRQPRASHAGRQPRGRQRAPRGARPQAFRRPRPQGHEAHEGLARAAPGRQGAACLGEGQPRPLRGEDAEPSDATRATGGALALMSTWLSRNRDDEEDDDGEDGLDG